MNPGLLRVVRTVIRADSDPIRQTLFANLARSRASVRMVYWLHQRLGATGAALLASSYGAAAFVRVCAPSQDARVVALAGHENARRQVESVVRIVGDRECAWVRTTPDAGRAASSLLRLLGGGRTLVKSFRVVRTIDRRHGFLVGCRAARALAWYVRAHAFLGRHRPAAVLVSSDSNPEELGLVGAARALRVPDVFVSHAYPTPLSPPLDFNLSILEGEAAVETRRRKGPIRGTVVLGGIDGDSAPMDARRFERSDPVVGIFTPKAVSWDTLAAILDDCRDHLRARSVVIRWHPSMLDMSRVDEVVGGRSGVIQSARSARLADIARQCDWVIADQNSNVHLPVLKLGIPTVGIRSLGPYPKSRADMYGFALNRIVLPPVDSIREVSTPDVLSFYSGDWASRFCHYDASYLVPEAARADRVRRAMLTLMESSNGNGGHHLT